MLLNSTQEYSTHEGPSGFSFGETLDITETAAYMDAEVTEILDNSLNSMTSVEEVTVYEITEYRQRVNVGQLLQHYPHIFVQLCDGEIIDAESGERIVDIDLTQFIVNNGLGERIPPDTDSILPSQVSPRSLQIDEEYLASTQQTQEGDSHRNIESVDSSVPRGIVVPTQPASKPTNALEQSSQPLLAHE